MRHDYNYQIYNRQQILSEKENYEDFSIRKRKVGAKNPFHAGPCMGISQGGQITRIPLEGNLTLKLDYE